MSIEAKRLMEPRHASMLLGLMWQPADAAHDKWHLRVVAGDVPAIAQKFNVASSDVPLIQISALGHDLVRSKGMGNELNDEEASASIVVRFLEEANQKGLFPTTPEQREAASFAIIHHGEPPVKNPSTLAEKAHAVLYTADGMQKLGESLIKRRSEHVGGTRRIEGDLQDFAVSAEQAVLMETAVRIGWITTQESFPDHVKDIIAEKYEMQREWIYGILAAQGYTMQTWAEMVYNTRNSVGKNIFEITNKIKQDQLPKSADEIRQKLEIVGGMNNEGIQQAAKNPDLMQSSIEAVDYFSSHYKDDSRQTTENWHPQGNMAKKWKNKLLGKSDF